MSWQNEYQQTHVSGPEDPRLSQAPPCPFCKSTNLSLSRMGNYVHCNSCGTDGPEVSQRFAIEERWVEALARWSAR